MTVYSRFLTVVIGVIYLSSKYIMFVWDVSHANNGHKL